MLKYFDKNSIALTNGISFKDILEDLFEGPYLSEDWLNLLSNVYTQCKIRIDKKDIDRAFAYIKKAKDKGYFEKFKEIDYESLITSQFAGIKQ